MIPKLKTKGGRPEPRGATIVAGGVNFSVYSENATQIWVCIFDEKGTETGRFALDGRDGNVHFGLIAGIGAGARYGLRAEGHYDPERGLWFDPRKLLLDPYAKRIDGRLTLHDALRHGREVAEDTAELVPKAIVCGSFAPALAPMKIEPRLVYELNVRGFTRLREDVAKKERGRVSALTSPEVPVHFRRIGVNVVQLMPVAAWLDDLHLPRLGLTNAWGYNPVPMMAPDPRLMPHGIGELREMTAHFREQGIAVILDVVFNHTGESDAGGPVLSYRGLDALSYYRHEEIGAEMRLVNDMGTGNTLRCDHREVQRLVIDALRHWVEQGGVSGFRLDLAPALGRDRGGFSPQAPLLEAIRNDPLLSQCLLMAEPWDPGPGGYQLGAFEGFYEHNDRFRDDIRAFWRGDEGKLGALASRLAGSADIFEANERRPSASVNMLAVHDGFTLRDIVSYAEKHNAANGERNGDGHGHNLSWNCGVEGETDDAGIKLRRKNDARALLATLMLARGTPLIQQGDEFWRTQGGNNNAYAQDNAITWVDWQKADSELIDYFAGLSAFRQAHPALTRDEFLTGRSIQGVSDVAWLHPDRRPMIEEDWHEVSGSVLGMHLNLDGDEVVCWFNRWIHPVTVHCPRPAYARGWQIGFKSSGEVAIGKDPYQFLLPERSVVVLTAEH